MVSIRDRNIGREYVFFGLSYYDSFVWMFKDSDGLVIHAMAMRPKYQRLLFGE